MQITEQKSFSTTKEIDSLKAQVKTYLVKDHSSKGLFIEVKPSSVKSWHYRYTLHGKQERLVLGQFPDLSLREARRLRDEAAAMVALGDSPHQKKLDVKNGRHGGVSVKDFGKKYYDSVITKDRKDPLPMLRILNNDIYPILGSKAMQLVTSDDIRDVIWRKKDQNYDAAAAQVRGLLKRMFDYALSMQVVKYNPVLAIQTRHVFKPVSRDRYLNEEEIKKYYTAMLSSRIYRPRKLAILLSLLTLVRKSELIKARWEHINFDKKIWLIPQENSKTDKEMNVYLSNQVIEIFKELKKISVASDWVFPGRANNEPIAHNTLNNALKVSLQTSDVPYFTIHDLRRTAATLLNEQGFNSDHIEKCLNHTLGGVRGTYNKAEYQDERIEMLKKWSDYIYELIYEPNKIFFNQQEIINE